MLLVKCGVSKDITHAFCFREFLCIENYACSLGISQIDHSEFHGIGAQHNSIVSNYPLLRLGITTKL